MTNTSYQPPTANLQRRRLLIAGGLSSVVCRLTLIVLLGMPLLALAACSTDPGQTTVQGSQSGGSISPDTVVKSFLEDLSNALEDPQLSNRQRRSEWVERMAGYFAPNERDDQRIALSSALESFVGGRGDLQPDEKMTLELRWDAIELLYEDSNRAMVRPVNGAIYVLITRTTNAGVLNLYEDTVSLDKIIGNQGSVPVVRIGRSWFLTEG